MGPVTEKAGHDTDEVNRNRRRDDVMANASCTPKEFAHLKRLTSIRGLLAVFTGAVFLLPETAGRVALVIGLFAVAGGTLNVALSISLCRHKRWRPLVGLGTLEMGGGIWLMLPAETQVPILMTAVGIWMIVSGFVALWYGLLIGYAERSRTFVMVSAAAGFVFGAAAAFWPTVTLSAMLRILTPYLIVVGLLQLLELVVLWRPPQAAES